MDRSSCLTCTHRAPAPKTQPLHETPYADDVGSRSMQTSGFFPVHFQIGIASSSWPDKGLKRRATPTHTHKHTNANTTTDKQTEAAFKICRTAKDPESLSVRSISCIARILSCSIALSMRTVTGEGHLLRPLLQSLKFPGRILYLR